MKWLKKVLLVVLVIIGLFLLIGAFLPGKASITRSVEIAAPAASVYAVLNNLKTYDHWMPWNQIDTNWKVEYAGVTEGKGAWYKWESDNPDVGKGKLTITESVPYQKVMTSLEFEGFDEPSPAGWEITASGNTTKVTWTMDAAMGHNPLNRWVGLFFDKLLGPQFESGLSMLKQKIESGELKPREPRMTVELKDIPAMQVLTLMDTAMTMSDIGPKLQKAYGELGETMKSNQLNMAGAPMSWYYSEKEPFILEPAIPVSGQPASLGGRTRFRKVPAGKAVVVHFYGPYEQSGLAYAKIAEWLKANKLTPAGAPYDVYVDDPTTKKDMYEVLTDIVQPVKQ
ncbi:SRPBCC family protein [Flavihumibacter rivuli]|uniref:SRPBCC family protein n=1 Tax=Flavihumibacter rivuli TaxID=2838156 RepID=UPI001BDF1A83|nr:SRPBCC family protein [Flavihumibacter rivuli]ULQ57564.1 SRPBCC family protein [Flavihumibacter rivuli]